MSQKKERFKGYSIGTIVALLVSGVLLYGFAQSSTNYATIPGAHATEGNNGMAFSMSMPSTIKGQISSIQLGENREPEWIQSGIWVIRINPGTDRESVPIVGLVVKMAMVRIDGTATHQHSIYNFTAMSMGTEGNSTQVLNGTATATLRDGPVSGVPLTVKIFGNSVIGLWIGPDGVDGHFGAGPVYGVLSTASMIRLQDITNMMIHDGAMQGTKPTNATVSESAGLKRSSVNYYGNATGYLVYPDNATQTMMPAVIMIHEWWGLNQNIKNMAEQLANEGYVVLAVDLYQGQVATESGQASQLASAVRDNPAAAIENLQAAVAYVSTLPNVNSSRIASLGWCFGGGQSLQLALNSQQPLAATIIYYGNLVTNQTELSVIDWPVLGIFGSEDQSIPVTTVMQFESALNANNIENEIHVYEGVGHAFANPSGDSYAAVETADAWQKTLNFLKKHV